MPMAPLAGVRVVDFTHHVAGPYCTRLLAEYGADVIKVERPGTGDPSRRAGPFVRDDPHVEGSLLQLHLNVAKRGITLDLKTAAGVEIAKKLAARAQVVVENFRPGTMDRLGLGYGELRALNSSLVMTSISNFGQTGPYRDYAASEIVAYAMGGPMQSTGHASREPLKLAGNIAQYQAGSVAAFATMAALLRAEATGESEHNDVSIYETQMGSRDRRTVQLTAYQYTGDVIHRAPTAVSLGAGVRPTSDGYIMLAAYGKRLPNLLRTIGREDLLVDPRVTAASGGLDREFVEDVEASYLEWSVSRPKAQALAEAQAERIVGASLNTIADLFRDPHFVERDPWDRIDHQYAGSAEYAGRPFIFSEAERSQPSPAPLLGQHTDEVLGELGYSASEIARLRAEGVL